MSKANFFDNIVKKAGNELASKAADGLETDVTEWVDTGSYSLNALLSGSIHKGMPSNKIVALAGEESTGKTFYALSIAKHFLETNPKGAVVYFETEGAVSTDMLKQRGIDLNRFFVIPVATIQEFRTQCVKIVDEYLATPKADRQPMFMVLDSLGMLSTAKEVSDIGEGKDTRDMTRAQLIRGTFRVLSLKLARANVPMLITNHTYEVVGAYVPTKEMSGGGGLKYAASIIVFLRKSKKRDTTDNSITGAIITAKLDKSRLTVEYKEVETLLDHQAGINKYYGVLDFMESQGFVKRVSKKVELPGGASAFESVVYKNPEKYFTKEVLAAADEAASKEFLYGTAKQTAANT